MGRDGAALIFLLPKEDAYVEFLHLRKVPLQPANDALGIIGVPPTETVKAGKALCLRIQILASADRDLYEKVGVCGFHRDLRTSAFFWEIAIAFSLLLCLVLRRSIFFSCALITAFAHPFFS